MTVVQWIDNSRDVNLTRDLLHRQYVYLQLKLDGKKWKQNKQTNNKIVKWISVNFCVHRARTTVLTFGDDFIKFAWNPNEISIEFEFQMTTC